jgi:photosystem II stability/assembly factor-like uncharacterized protein
MNALKLGQLRVACLTAVAWSLMAPYMGGSDTCTNPTSNTRVGQQPSADETLGDRPAQRSQWFLAGRRVYIGPGLAAAESQQPPARRLLQSIQQVYRLPRPGLAAALEPWVAVGPSPVHSLYWGNVTGRVTSLAADTRDQKHVIYVGTAYGGLWRALDFTSSTPTFEPLSDTLWPSLAVGSIALDTSRIGEPVIYVGTGEGNEGSDSYYGIGVLKSVDGGRNWTLSTGAGLPVALTSSAEFNLDGPFVGVAIPKIVIDAANPSHILAAVSASPVASRPSSKTGIYESNNGGQSWKIMNVAGGVVSPYNTSDLIYEPLTQTFYAAIQGLGFYALPKGGTEWRRLASPFVQASVNALNFDRSSLAARSQGAQVTLFALISAGYFADNDPRNYDLSKPSDRDTGLVFSNDGGASWKPLPAPTDLFDGQGFYDQWVAAPANGTVIAGGIDIWRSNSAAPLTWANLTSAYDWAGGLAHPDRHVHSDQHAAIFLNADNWIVGNDGGVWRTEDDGVNWINLNSNINSIQFTSVTPLASSGQAYLGGSQDNGTTIGSAPGTWPTTLTGDGGFTAAGAVNISQYFTERFKVSLCRSDNAGKTWNTVVDRDTIKESSAFYVPYELVHANPDYVLLGAQRVWMGPAVPSSAGKGWRPISKILAPNGYVAAIASSQSSPGIVYAAASDSQSGDSQVFINRNVLAANAANNWFSIQRPNLPSNRIYSAVAIDPKNPKIAYLAVQGFGLGHIFRTDDQGLRWNDITPSIESGGEAVQIDAPINSILIDPDVPSDVYVASDVGVFVSTDRGKTWQPHGTGLPRTAIVGLKLSTGRQIVAATHGRGAWVIDPVSR